MYRNVWCRAAWLLAAASLVPLPALGAEPAAASGGIGSGTCGTAPALPELPADLPPSVRAYLEALNRRVQELEKKLAERKPAEPAPAATPAPEAAAPALRTPRGARLEIGG